MASSVSFDRIADSYDETRGGLERGGNIARAIAAHLRPGPVVEIGVGTAAVALPLEGAGHPVVGFDLSLKPVRGRRSGTYPTTAGPPWSYRPSPPSGRCPTPPDPANDAPATPSWPSNAPESVIPAP